MKTERIEIEGGQRRAASPQVSRRTVVAGLGAAGAALGASSWVHAATDAAQRVLPLRNLGLEHLDILVPDTARSARFYMQVFNAPLHQQEFRETLRYFVLLGDLPQDRQVGYIAIGAGFGRPIQIGHYCALAEPPIDRNALTRELEAAGYPPPGGGFGMVPDPDGLELQLFTPPAGLVNAAVPSDLEVDTGGIFVPTGMDHVLLYVSDLDRALEYYRFVYGEGLDAPDPENPNRVWFELPADTRIGLERAPTGEAPRIERFGIKVEPFDVEQAHARLHELDALVLSGPEHTRMVRFRDNYGITLQVDAPPG